MTSPLDVDPGRARRATATPATAPAAASRTAWAISARCACGASGEAPDRSTNAAATARNRLAEHLHAQLGAQ
jgi:hypothetical protein